MADENETPPADAESTPPAKETAPATETTTPEAAAPAEQPKAAEAEAEAAPSEAPAPEREAPAADSEQPGAPAADSEKPGAPAADSEKPGAPAADGEKPGAPAADGEKPGAPGNPAAGDASKGPPKKKDIFAEIDPKEAEAVKIVKAKGSKNVTAGIVHVSATFNNTIVSVTDRQGNVLGWSSSGKMGFRGSRKSTAYASQLVAQDACRQAMSHGLKEAEVRVKGPGSGREAAARAVQNLGIEVTVIKDVTPIPHNGCRPPKARRV
jgi:small subunit ribosomal protein S11